MRHEWAKIFSLGDYQVLLRKGDDHDRDESLLISSVQLADIHVEISGGYKDAYERDAAFEKYNEDFAKDFLESSLKQFA